MFNEPAEHLPASFSCHGGDPLPPVFCWTKMGSEAGQGLEAILGRKELERLSGDGFFSWGIGNSVGPAVVHARQLGFDRLDVLFTRMKSAPKASDVSPAAVLLWTAYEGIAGERVALPAHMLITSRGDAEARVGGKRSHYALLCQSARSLLSTPDDREVDASSVCNLVSKSPTGASQVTAVVRAGPPHGPRKPYPVQFRASLAGPGFVRLACPVLVTAELLPLYEQAVSATSVREWRDRVHELRCLAERKVSIPAAQSALFN